MTTTLAPQAISSLMAGPASTPPPGVTPNFQNAANTQQESRNSLLVGLAIMWTLLIMRLYTQWLLKKVFVVEDFFATIAVIITSTQVGIFYKALSPGYGCGYHMWDQTLATYLKTQRLFNVYGFVYIAAIALIKMALLTQIRRVFAPVRQASPWVWYGSWIWSIIFSTFYLVTEMLGIFQCSPRSKAWDPFVPGHCDGNVKVKYITTASFNILSDALILALPLPALYNLQMKRSMKALTGSLFGIAALACVVSILRLYFSIILISNPDVSWNWAADALTAVYEDVIGIVVFCLPVAPTFIEFLRNNVRPSHDRSSSSERSDEQIHRYNYDLDSSSRRLPDTPSQKPLSTA